jgi:predicted cupin superfamily sugar epimerase
VTPERIIELLDLRPHPEGGWYRQTWLAGNDGRPTGTAIYFLLNAGERSHWHRVDATEIWHFHDGAPIELLIARDAEGPAQTQILGPDLETARPQVIVPEGYWQSARSLGAWTLVSCTVSPGFRFDGFELAPADFDIPRVEP